MRKKLLGNLFKLCSLELPASVSPELEISYMTEDSRKVKPGSLFVAMKGSCADGHQYLEDAVKRGAAFLILEESSFLKSKHVPHKIVSNSKVIFPALLNAFYDAPSQEISVVGVTGTNGKTTTAYLLQHLLGKTACGFIGTLFADTGSRKITLENTTPGFSDVSSLLAEMRSHALRYCAMEVSSHALEQDRLQGCQFRAKVFTNLTQDHLDYHQTMEAYYQSKKKLFQENAPGTFSLINLDDFFGKKLYAEIPGLKYSYGLSPEADYQALEIKSSLTESSFLLRSKKAEGRLKTSLPCFFNLYNVLAAVSCALELGESWENLQERLLSFPGVSGRMERIVNDLNFPVFVDYAHTPDAFENVLGEVKRVFPGKIITVFGCGGERDRQKRPLMAQAASRFSDRVFLTNDNPRGEAPQAIFQDLLKGVSQEEAKKVVLIEDRQKAIEKAVEGASQESVVLILGKGHEAEQEIKGQKIPFQDQVIAQRALQRRAHEVF